MRVGGWGKAKKGGGLLNVCPLYCQHRSRGRLDSIRVFHLLLQLLLVSFVRGDVLSRLGRIIDEAKRPTLAYFRTVRVGTMDGQGMMGQQVARRGMDFGFAAGVVLSKVIFDALTETKGGGSRVWL